MSTKYQITLPVPLADELKQTAMRLKIPLAQFMRETMEARLRQEREKVNTDPFASITGLIDDGETDLSSRVDEILYR